MLGEQPEGEDEVEPRTGEPVEPARVADFILDALDTAERDARSAPGFVAVQSFGASKLVGFHLEMEAQLLVHVGLGASAKEDRANALARCPVHSGELLHAGLPSQARTQFTAADARSHCARSRASSPAPARVST